MQEEEEAGFHIKSISHRTDEATQTAVAIWLCKTYVPDVGTDFLNDMTIQND